MDIIELTAAATEALAAREPTGTAVTSVTVEPSRDESGWISYADAALVTHLGGETRHVNIRDKALSVALDKHADDEAELGSVQTVVIPICDHK
ncbi:hypothetical protein ACFU8W_48540 [Streptomyces sp. NPDC057565]|uniref:hypothetical protein n=1 Tax=Streptomyces sp. NPDC057565 TaxID=3346169 RepID=UPI0036915B53